MHRTQWSDTVLMLFFGIGWLAVPFAAVLAIVDRGAAAPTERVGNEPFRASPLVWLLVALVSAAMAVMLVRKLRHARPPE